MISAILFDMDGVLIDSHDAWFYNFNSVLEHFGYTKITIEEFDREVWAVNFTKTIVKYFTQTPGEIREYANSQYDKFIKIARQIPEVDSTLKKLKKKGLLLGVATNTHSAFADKLLSDLGIRKPFSYLVGGDMVKNGKPEPDMLLKALIDLKLSKKDVLFVGDTIWDKMAAQKSGIPFVGYQIDGDYRIDKFSDLLNFVK